MTAQNLTPLDELKLQYLSLLEEKNLRLKYNQLDMYFPSVGKYNRTLYPKHLEFFTAGKDFSERGFIAANRVGKTVAGGVEMSYHLTGKYPDWWEGHKFDKPIAAWVGTLTTGHLKSPIQKLLFGSFADKGTGMIPKECMLADDGSTVRTWNMPGVPNVVGTALIRHHTDGVFDGWSSVEFKAYEQGWEKFQSDKLDLIWLDEEPKDPQIYTECCMRTAGDEGDTGIIYCTFTPLLGFSDTVLGFLPGGRLPEGGINTETPWRKVINAGWDDVPHLSSSWKQQKLAGMPSHQRDARSKGIPTKGLGAVFPVPEEYYVVDPVEGGIPAHWPRAFGMDFGWTHPTCVVWVAQDPDTKVKYVYSEHSLMQATAPIHASAIRQRGAWIRGVCDPAARASAGPHGLSFLQSYTVDESLNITPARGGPGTKEVQIAHTLTELESGMLKIYSNCTKLISGIGMYRRDEKGNIVKKGDDEVDALLYVDNDFDLVASCLPDPDNIEKFEDVSRYSRDPITGY